MTNLLIALANIIENPIVDLQSTYQGSNRANNMGDALETYVRDIFCNSIESDDSQKDRIYNQHFSYLGNQNNPPDNIIRNGDAIEVKKLEKLGSAIALNSSYPKNKLYSDDSRITEYCRNCEEVEWAKKDIIYSVGVVPQGTRKLKALWFVYGDCYAASRDIYKKISDKITKGISEIPGVEFAKTNELAGVKKVDPLGITNLRVRGMWHIKNPIKVFRNFAKVDDEHDLTVNALLLTEKYFSFPEQDRLRLEKLQNEKFLIQDIQVKCPNNPAQLLAAKLISYSK
jgi:hypothetical protein